jgi:hypothetical protein
MKHIIIIGIFVAVVLFFMTSEKTGNNKVIVDTYPWQITVLPDGRSKVFGIVLGETQLKDVDQILRSRGKVALFESKNGLSLEAYYKSVTKGNLTGSYVFSLDAPEDFKEKIKNESVKKERTEMNNIRYDLDMHATDNAKKLVVKNINYIPAVQFDDELIIKRFGVPAQKIKLEGKQVGWHYLYPDKGLDVIYSEEGKEVLQYVAPKDFNALIEPLLSRQSQ